MRVCGASQNTLKMFDNLSGTELSLTYRQPTTSERQGFQNMAIKRRRNKVTTHYAEARLRYGLAIMTGFKAGDFGRLKDGKPVPMATDPGHADYYEGWKKEVEAGAADIVMTLAAHVFESPAEITEADDPEPGEPIEGE